MTNEFRALWRSGAHVGAAQPTMVVSIQTGRWRRTNSPWEGDVVDARIPGETKRAPFRPHWEATSPWVTIPGVLAAQVRQDFEQQGVPVLTLDIENTRLVEASGHLGGVYHLIDHGFLSPYRGYVGPNRPNVAHVGKSEWYDLLARKARIRVWQGYGAPTFDAEGQVDDDASPNGAWVFNGHIDDIDATSTPRRITLTARMATTLTDQRVFGWAKSRSVLDPITFCDRLEAAEMKERSGGAAASTSRNGHPAKFVSDRDSKTAWISRNHTTPSNTQWVEIRLPAGHYEDFILHPAYDGMEVYVGLYLKNRPKGKKPLVDGQPRDEGWLALGNGLVPGEHGGWPWIARYNTHTANPAVHTLGVKVDTGDGAILRVGFRNLKKITTGVYRASVVKLSARQFKTKEEKEEQRRWILVDDVSDLVKVALRWAGFNEWEIETTGVRLKGKFVVNRSSYLVDIVKKAVEQTGYVFFIDRPHDGESHGVPIFRRNRAIAEFDDIEEIRESDLLSALKVKVTEEVLAYNIRIRGQEAKEEDGGIPLGALDPRRIMAYYKPPWARGGRLSGVIKHVTHVYPELKTFDECLTAAYLTALAQALQAVTGVAEIPGNPFVSLDEQVGLFDTATGMNTRMWVGTIDSTFRAGVDTSWTTSLGGSLIDNPDLDQLIAEMRSDMPNPIGASDGSFYSVG